MPFPLRLLAAVLLLASCDRSPVDSEPDETSFTFSYRLGTAAWQSFSARGQQPPGTSLSARGPWVFTGGVPPYSTLVVNALQQTGSGWLNLWTYVPNTAAIDSVFLGDADAMTCPGGPSPCTSAVLRIETAAGTATELCVTVNGKMVITRRTADWVSGRFSGTGVCRAGGAQRPFELRDGEFDIALPPPAAGPG